MRPRHPHEPHRATSSLELFFDLVFVIAVGGAASSFHHALTENHVQHGVVGFIVMFFSIWWAWVNFTWFATSFDCDDWLYRVLTIFQMSGVIVFSTGIPAGFDGDFRIVVAGYVIMRICMATQWFRAGLTNPEYRATAFRYGWGILAVQVLWVLRLIFIADSALGLPTFILLGLAEIAVPIFAEQKKLTPWPPHHNAITSFRSSLTYGYVHYFVFASAAAFAAGIELLVDVETGRSHLTERGATLVYFDILIPFPAVWTTCVLIAIVAILVARNKSVDA